MLIPIAILALTVLCVGAHMFACAEFFLSGSKRKVLALEALAVSSVLLAVGLTIWLDHTAPHHSCEWVCHGQLKSVEEQR